MVTRLFYLSSLGHCYCAIYQSPELSNYRRDCVTAIFLCVSYPTGCGAGLYWWFMLHPLRCNSTLVHISIWQPHPQQPHPLMLHHMLICHTSTTSNPPAPSSTTTHPSKHSYEDRASCYIICSLPRLDIAYLNPYPLSHLQNVEIKAMFATNIVSTPYHQYQCITFNLHSAVNTRIFLTWAYKSGPQVTVSEALRGLAEEGPTPGM